LGPGLGNKASGGWQCKRSLVQEVKKEHSNGKSEEDERLLLERTQTIKDIRRKHLQQRRSFDISR
jgi:hypothetical protein